MQIKEDLGLDKDINGSNFFHPQVTVGLRGAARALRHGIQQKIPTRPGHYHREPE
jgi:hypothetical protein